MNCPNDNATLVMTDRQGVEIDYCPECRGVWLDRGELDKIIDRAGDSRGTGAGSYEQRGADRSDHKDRRDRDSYGQKKKRRENFLGDLFEF